MKSWIYILIFTLVIFVIGSAILYNVKTINDIDGETVHTQVDKVNNIDKKQSSKVLIAYYSRTGNTREMATQIQKATGADIQEIMPITPCPEDQDACKAIASKQKEEHARPEFTTTIENIDDYDVIFVGYPLWLSTMPMHMFTFLESYDFSGKTVIPFCTSGSGEIGESESDIARSLSESTILKGLVIKGVDIAESNDEVLQWIDGLNIEMY